MMGDKITVGTRFSPPKRKGGPKRAPKNPAGGSSDKPGTRTPRKKRSAAQRAATMRNLEKARAARSR